MIDRSVDEFRANPANVVPVAGSTHVGSQRAFLASSSIVALGLVLTATTPSRAVDWNGSVSNDWFNGTNWAGGGIPTDLNTGVIDQIVPNATVVGAPGARVSQLVIGNLGTGRLTIQNGGSVSSSGGDIGFTSGSSGGVRVNGPGSNWTVTNELIVGRSGAGSLVIENGGFVNSRIGSIGRFAGSGGGVVVDGPGSTWNVSGALAVGASGLGTLTLNNGGAVNVGGAVVIAGNAGSVGRLNIGAAAGLAATAPGTLNTASVAFGSGNGRILFNHTSSSYIFSPAIAGAGAVDVHAGTTVLTAASSYTGPTTVSGGTLEVNGSIASSSLLSVTAGATIAGTGTLPSTVVSGGHIAPGSGAGALGTLTVNGNLQLDNGAIYQLDLGQPGTADRISVSGTTSIGNAGVSIVTANPIFVQGTRDAILTSAGGVSGTFANQPQQLPLVTLSLSYDANNVYLDVTRNQTPVSAVAATPNQAAVGASVQSLQAGSTLSNAVVGQRSVAAVQQALDALSGQSHASLRSSLIEESRFVREAIYNRLNGAMIGFGLDGTYTADLPSRKAAPAVPTLTSTSGITTWGNAFGSWSNRERTAEDASLKRSIGGFMLGADKAVGTHATIGIAGGYSRSDISIRGRNADADIDNYHAAIYGGAMFGNWALRGGAAYTWHEIDVDRSVSFPGFADRLKASYSGRTAQAFGELGYKLALGSVEFEPFAGLAHVNLDMGRFTEIGGAAAVTGRGTTDNVTFTTLGLKLQSQFSLFNGMSMTARGLVGWRHAFGDVDPATTIAFVAGGLPHSVAGLPVARDAAVVEAGLDMNINAAMKLGISYSGQISDQVQDHGVKGSFIWKF